MKSKPKTPQEIANMRPAKADKKRFNYYMTAAYGERIKELAEKLGTKESYLVEEALRVYLAETDHPTIDVTALYSNSMKITNGDSED
ncbi:MAG: hypothetical protein NVS1B10_07960 [Candidatus Saccharimonadales bacterium]